MGWLGLAAQHASCLPFNLRAYRVSDKIKKRKNSV
jgi:hypothetical protein